MQPPVFDRAAAKRAGYTDAEIDAFLAKQAPAALSRPTVGRVAAESTATGGAPMVAGTVYATDPKAVLRQVGQGLTGGWADEGEAGVRSLFGGDYTTIRDDIRRQNREYQDANPKAALALQVGGGLLTGGVGVMAGAGRVAQAPSVMRAIGRALATGGAAGAVAGAGGSEAMTAEGVAKDAAIGGAAGGLLGGGVAAASKAVPAVARTARALVQGQKYQPTVSRSAGRVLDAIQNAGKTLDDVAATYADDSRAILAEKIGDSGVELLGNSARLGYKAPGVIKASLERRASGEIPLVRKTLAQETAAQVNPKTFAKEKLLEAQSKAGPIFDEAIAGVRVTDGRIPTMLKRPAIRDAWSQAVKMAANDGVEMPSFQSVIKNATGKASNMADETLGVATRAGGKADAVGDDVLNMTQEELRGVRRGGPLSTMTPADLEAERLYLLQEQGKDQGLAAIRESQDYAEYLALRSAGNTEDARGVMERMGYYDPHEFNQSISRDAAAAAKRLEQRTKRLAKVEEELARRTEAGPLRSVPGRGAVSVPEPSEAPALPTVDARHLQYVKFALRDQLTALEGKQGGTSTTLYAQTQRALDDVDNLLYDFGNKAEDGTNLWGKANDEYAKPMQEAGAFSEGSRDAFNVASEDVDGALAKGPAYARGMSNRILRQLSKYNKEAAAGNIRNPAPLLTGSDEADARLAIMTRGNTEKADRVRNTALGASRRLNTRYEVLGNSKTAGRMASDAKQLESTLENADVTSPSGMMRAVGTALQTLAKRRVTGRELDEASRFLLAGDVDQMAIETAMKTLNEEQRKRIGRALSTQFIAGGTTGNVIGQRMPTRR